MMKRILILGFVALLFISCGGNDNDIVKPDPTPDPDVVETVLAKNDSFQAVENTTVDLPSFLTNDEYSSSGVTVTFDNITTNDGTIEIDRDLYTYIPANNFSGNDTFTYTICSKKTPAICSTATVTINVTDTGNPEAVNDSYNTGINSTLTISSYLENDTIIDGAEIESINSTTATGNVVLNADGTISYTPQTDFTGADSFTYTICDSDAVPSCSTATITVTVVESISFNIPADLANYYSDVSFINDKQSNYNALKDLLIRTHTTTLSYGQRHTYLYDADEDLNNAANVILMYTGESRDEREYTSGTNSHQTQTFNTEHIYPQSRLSSTGGVTDLHHLRSCDASINSERSNYPFVDGSGTYTLVNGNAWFPGDEWKGDVARMIFYLNVRYGETFDKVGSMELFLKWNKEDPVSDFEKQRNNLIAGAQGNRNPFIDNPYLITITWGGDAAANTWN